MSDPTRQQKRAAARSAGKAAQRPATPSMPPPEDAQPPPLDASARERWRTAALALGPDEVTFGPSVRVLLAEAPLAARFVARYWEPAVDPLTKAVRTPGLKGSSRHLSLAIVDEITTLCGLTEEAHGRWILTSGGAGDDPVARGRFVLGEMRATLQFVADEGGHGDLPAQIARVQETHAKDGDSREDLASSLHDWSVLAEAYAEVLDGVGGFAVSLIPEASRLAAALRALPGAQQEASGDAREKIDLRNRYAALLQARVATVRGVARFVFRHHPKVAREAASAWERNRRAAALRKKKNEKPAAPK